MFLLNTEETNPHAYIGIAQLSGNGSFWGFILFFLFF